VNYPNETMSMIKVPKTPPRLRLVVAIMAMAASFQLADFDFPAS